MWDSYFGLWVAGPHYFPWCVGWVPLPKNKISYTKTRHTVPHFPKISLILVDLHLFLTHIFPVCVLCTPILVAFMLRASLLTPNFRSFYLLGCLWHPSEVNWVPSGNLSFGPLIRCLLLKHWLIFLLVFLYLTRLKARQILSRLLKEGT